LKNSSPEDLRANWRAFFLKVAISIESIQQFQKRPGFVLAKGRVKLKGLLNSGVADV
jgi:hypothetical protein